MSAILPLVVAFKLFGASDRVVYGCQAIFCIILLLVFIRRLGSISQAALLFAIGSTLGCWDRSAHASFNSLPAVIVFCALWESWSKTCSLARSAFLGAAVGVGCTFRPECLLLLVYLCAFWLISEKRDLRQIACCIGSFMLPIVIVGAVRSGLKAGDTSDHLFFNGGSNIYAWGMETVGLPRFISLTELLAAPSYRMALLNKIYRSFGSFFALKSAYFERPDCLLLAVALVGNLTRVLSWRRYLPVYFLLLCIGIETALIVEFPRYYDILSTVLLLCLWQDCQNFFRHYIGMLRILLMIAVIPLGVSTNATWRQNDAAFRHRTATLAQLESADRIISKKSLIVSDQPHLWSWYKQRDRTVYIPTGYPTTLQMLIGRYPDTSVVIFLGHQRTYGSLREFIAVQMKLVNEGPEIYLPKSNQTAQSEK